MGHGERGFRALLLLALASGCSDLTDIAGGECGNRVLEPGEDCDGFTAFGDGTACAPADDADNACHYICDTTSCPPGWGCGADGRCRQFGGWFADTGVAWEFDADDFAIGDIDGDGNPDLLGNDDSSLMARFGAGDGTLPSTLNVVGREPTGPVTYTTFDADARLDAVVPTAAGLFVVRGQQDRTLEPVAYSPFDLDLEGSLRIAAVESEPNNTSTEVLMVRSAVIGERAALHFVGSTALPQPLPVDLSADLLADHLPVADLDGDERDEVALVFQGDSRVWIYTSTGQAQAGSNTLAPLLWQQIDVGVPLPYGVRFADVNLDGHIDLLTATGTDVWTTLVLYGNAIDSRFGAPAPLPAFDGAGSPLPLAIAAPVYVYPSALYLAYYNGVQGSPPDGLYPIAYPPTNTWKEAAFGDFNGDGQGDFAAIIDSRDGVDVTLNAGYGLFNRFHVDTSQPARGLRVGDFDGDLVHDVAFVEDGQGVTADGLSVIFGGASAGPSAAVSMGRTGYIEAMEPIFAAGGQEAIDGVTDLFVVSASWPEQTTRAVAIMLGGASRRLMSPFTLMPDPLAPFPDVPMRALVGDLNGDGIQDIGAIASRFWDAEPNSPLGFRSLFYGIPGRGDSGDLDASGVNIVQLQATSFDHICGLWASGDVDSDGVPEVVGIDGTVLCAVAGIQTQPPRLLVGTVGATTFDAQVTELTTDLRLVIDVELADMDADGDLDLLVLAIGDVFNAETGPEAAAGRGLEVWWNDGSGGFASPSPVSLDGSTFVIDASPMPMATGTASGVVMFADAGTMIARPDPDADHAFMTPETVFWATGEGRVRAADLDRDGVIDLAVSDGTHVYVLLGFPAPPLGGSRGDDGTVEPPVGQ